MADRIIDASILKNKPKVFFSTNNIINGVEWEENIFGSKHSVYTLDIEFPSNDMGETTEALMRAQFTKETYKNIVYIQVGIRKYVSFDIDFEISADFLLNDLSVETKVDALHFDTALNKIYNPKLSEDLMFYVLTKKEDFSSKSDGENGKIALFRYTTTRFNMQLKLLYSRVPEIGLSYYINKRSINFFASEQLTKQKSIGSSNSYVLQSNELLRIDTANFDGHPKTESEIVVLANSPSTPIGQVIANNILQKYKYGKTRLVFSVFISSAIERFQVGEIAKVYGFDGKSVSRNRDGTDKRFKITSAEFRWAGQSTQNLEMVEVIE